MSERVQNWSTDAAPMTKSQRRAAAKAAAARAAEAKRRRQALLNALAGLAVIAVIVATFLLVGGDDEPAGQTAGSSASANASGLPAGADPALGSKPKVTPGSGELAKLTVTPLVKGTGPATRAGQQITVNYVGAYYKTGQEFDASWDNGQPFSFMLGGGNVIEGWDKGLVGVNVGSRVQLDIPAEQAYGENPGGGRPGGPLRFVVDVLAVR